MLMGESGELELMLHHQSFDKHPALTDPRGGEHVPPPGPGHAPKFQRD